MRESQLTRPLAPRHAQYDASSSRAPPTIADTPAWKALQEHVVDIEQTCATGPTLGMR